MQANSLTSFIAGLKADRPQAPLSSLKQINKMIDYLMTNDEFSEDFYNGRIVIFQRLQRATVRPGLFRCI